LASDLFSPKPRNFLSEVFIDSVSFDSYNLSLSFCVFVFELSAQFKCYEEEEEEEDDDDNDEEEKEEKERSWKWNDNFLFNSTILMVTSGSERRPPPQINYNNYD
jgi:hypothetical protein